MRIVIIGGGTIGGAFGRALITARAIEPEHLLFVEKKELRCNDLRVELKCYASASYFQNISEGDLIVIAVKPQDFPLAAEKLRRFIKPTQTVLSVMAGVTVATISQALNNHANIIRTMPNLPFIYGKGITAYLATQAVPEDTVKKVIALLKVCGETMPVNSEDLLDAATAISGSGPGYLLYIIKHYMEECVALGFSKDEAKKLVTQTMNGTAHLFMASSESAESLRQKVTSTDGTTHAAIKELESCGVGKIFRSAIKAAYNRAKELSQ